ncbi:bifunctional 4-hydroxy-2-oxoglutarate aldolase/2-dehydro-3-deoxy-phosphogluconate aldolase [Mobiluncus sp.]|uniref:bifunctional 4-hydroxy-2-oxoglutarate aldolase/2-dehydro-3-deoxy-phosphogluconate aldolase n=1 Tax=Mobiluncus sp. TaxID=47293 RepID=UPI002A91B3FF|nr:bifunctional 4-hydroxy-2-oxoglutarate aldolase/2-dehydro-3-deoxy-phosphogluconate aldolase [Mobiluncus sp.]MDY6077444.1 bifunctional 4-hydroxy-2-oxoglutarate aldolase/2-dehydro-3-deoxy-phosphogluconate aldolase [Mobiluncus sp.]
MRIPSAMPLLAENPIVPVVVLDRVEDAVPTARALLEGGIKSAEVTFRTPVAVDCIAAIFREVPEITVGAGTVVNKEQARRAVDAGAKFLVSPGVSKEVAKAAAEANVPLLPGIANPTDIMATLKWGLEVVKFFPASALGGLGLLKAFAGPFPQMKFMPTGGVNPDNLGEWLSAPFVPAVGGSWMVSAKLVHAADFAQITRLSAEAIAKVKEIRQ